MPIAVACPSCREKLVLLDKAGGSVMPCPNCGVQIRIPASVLDAVPLRRARRAAKTEDEKTGSEVSGGHGTSPRLLAVAALALFLFCGGIVAIGSLGRSKSSEESQEPIATATKRKPPTVPFPTVFRRERSALTAPASPVQADFADVSLLDHCRVGDLGVSAARAYLAPVELRTLRTENRKDATQESYFQVVLAMGNDGDAAIEYKPWGQSGASLIDDLGQVLPPYSPGGSDLIDGQSYGRTLHPHDAMGDWLVFQAPSPRADSALLTLSAENVGYKGVLRFKIPRSEWKERSTPPD